MMANTRGNGRFFGSNEQEEEVGKILGNRAETLLRLKRQDGLLAPAICPNVNDKSEILAV